jgi:flavin reductase (DIM6/NTAB) family NADH-FMN oxidoreductase RutF
VTIIVQGGNTVSKVSVSISNDFCPQTLFLYGTYKEDGTPNFGLFCWFSYIWDSELGVMACIGGEKLTKDRIHATGVFSANLVTEAILSLADYFGNTDGYGADKMDIPVETRKGAVLDVPILDASPLAFELEVAQSIPLHDGEVFLCKIRNVLANEELADDTKTIEERLQVIAPVRTTCRTYFSWDGKAMGKWGEPMRKARSLYSE